MNVIVVSAHPDDETLGCGGTLLKHKSNGHKLFWLITTSISETIGFQEAVVKRRANEILEVSEQYAFEEIFYLDYPTAQLTDLSVITMIPKISEIFSRIKPEVIYLPNRSDAHSDHLYTFRSVIACTKSFRAPYVKRVLMYECISETEFSPALHENIFIPNHFVDISDYLAKKLEIMCIYESEVSNHPFPRSLRNIKALATSRGATIGTEYAESFHILKSIDK